MSWPWITWLVAGVLALPVAAGLLGTLLPAFGHLPALGADGPSLDPFRDVVSWPGFWPSLFLSLRVGVISTLAALGLAVLICATLHRTRLFQALTAQLGVLLAVPHAAAAFALAFLIAPSGLLARAVSPWGTGWEQPPDLLIVNDPFGWSLIAGLLVKEVPFLLLVILAALGQARAAQAETTARALGYRPATAWIKTILPSVYAQIRLPVYAVLAFSMSVVDMALILGPNTPPPLAVQVVSWMNDPDLGLRLQAAAGAVVQLALVVGALALWRWGEVALAWIGRRWTMRGGRGAPMLERVARGVSALSGGLFLGGLAAGLLGLVLWSFAGLWPFPEALPEPLTLRNWERFGPRLGPPLVDTILIALAALAIALTLSIASLEAEHRNRLKPGQGAMWLLYLPLVVPQIAFLGGLQIYSLSLGLNGGRAAVILAHVVFVLPYVFLTLSGPWRAWDPRYGIVARALGRGPGGVLWRIRLPMLLAPILTASAIGLSVSVGQYLPTLLIGGGRVSTLTTEAIALAAGGDRRIIAIFALAQTALALAPFVLAVWLPRWMEKR